MRLSIFQNDRFVRAISVAKDSLRIGRMPTCDVVLEGDGVARYHALVERGLDGGWTVVSMGPSGTLLNGNAVTALAKAKLGDEIAIGPYRVVLIDDTLAPNRLPTLPPDPPELVIVQSGSDLVAAPVAPVLWSATADEMSSEPTTGEVALPLDLIDPDEPVYLLTQRKRT
jgi:pSer/pThr/pTyr-binding forkhead associated (FHA) protein